MSSSASQVLLRPLRTQHLSSPTSNISWLAPCAPSASRYARHTPRRRPLQYRSSLQCRTIHTSPTLHGGRGAGHTLLRDRGKKEKKFEERSLRDQSSKQPSMKVRVRQMFLSDEVPEDLGIFPETLIMPTGPDMPSIISLERLKMNYQRVIKRFKDLASVLLMKYTFGLRKHKLNLRKTAPTAMAIHRQVYSALADGDEAEVRRLTTEGVRDSLINQIQARDDTERWGWDLVRYVGRPRVVSHRASQIPIPEVQGEAPSMMRQAVVKIRSKQKLTREQLRQEEAGEGEIEEAKEEGQKKQGEKKPTEWTVTVEEYVVIQKRVLRGVEEPWKFWGTTEPTKVEEFEKALRPPVPDAGETSTPPPSTPPGVA